MDNAHRENLEVDFLFVGEAEHSLPQFLDQYERGSDLSEVRGIIYKSND